MIATQQTMADYCICCSSRIASRDEFCGECQTPASLSHSVVAKGGVESFISVLGASNAGKTVYLGLLLDILSKGNENFRGVASSSFSVDLQENVVNALERRMFPEKTPNEVDEWQWLHCKISMARKKQTRSIDLVSPDFAGEAIASEITQPGLYPAVRHVVTRSSGILILCDSVRVRDEGAGEDLFAMKVASYVAEQHRIHGTKRASAGPSVAIVFTKCDSCPEAIQDPTAFAKYNTSRLYEFCTRTFRRTQFFAASVAGSSGILTDSNGWESRIPFHVQPYGIIEPLQWLVEE
ncbi:MAG: hypothetical protein AAF483_10925 [Planctomycetota bacterium]